MTIKFKPVIADEVYSTLNNLNKPFLVQLPECPSLIISNVYANFLNISSIIDIELVRGDIKPVTAEGEHAYDRFWNSFVLELHTPEVAKDFRIRRTLKEICRGSAQYVMHMAIEHASGINEKELPVYLGHNLIKSGDEKYIFIWKITTLVGNPKFWKLATIDQKWAMDFQNRIDYLVKKTEYSKLVQRIQINFPALMEIYIQQ